MLIRVDVPPDFLVSFLSVLENISLKSTSIGL